MIWTLIFVVALLITLGYATALLFHWAKYGGTLPLVWVALPLYLGGAGFLILIALVAYASLP